MTESEQLQTALGTPASKADCLRARAWAARSQLLVAGLLVYALVFMGALWNVGCELGDEGVALVGAWRIAQGYVPHRDLFEIIPPVSFLPLALVFRVFGSSLLASRLVSMAYGIALIVLSDRLLTRYCTALGPRLVVIAFLIPFGVWHWPMPSHHWLVDILQLSASLCLLCGLQGPRTRWWGFLAGGLTAAACLTLQDQGGIFLGALTFAFFPWIRRAQTRRALVAGWLAGAGSVGTVFLGYSLATGSSGELWYQMVHFPMAQYRHLPGNQSSVLAGWEAAATLVPWRAPADLPGYIVVHDSMRLLNMAYVAALPVAASGVMLVAFVKRWEERERLCLLLALLLAFLGTACRRYALKNLDWAAPAMLVLVAIGLDRAMSSPRAWRRRLGTLCAGVLVTTPLLYSAAHLYHYTATDRTRVISTEVGSLRMGRNAESQELQRLLTNIERHVPKGAALYCSGYIPLVNFLARRPNPTRYKFFLHPGYHTSLQRDEVLGTLEGRSDAWILTPARFTAREAWLQPLLEKRFFLAWRDSSFALFGPRPRNSRQAGHAGQAKRGG